MIDRNIKLTVLTGDGVSFEDISSKCFDYSRDNLTLTLLATNYIYVGYKKPVNSLYVGLVTPNSNTTFLHCEYWDGTSWVELTIQDDTNALSRSGFIQWDRVQDSTRQDILSNNLHWFRFYVEDDTSAMSLSGISFLFADDNDLAFEVPEITDTNHLAGKTSHILTHVAVRNQIIQDLRSLDYKKTNQTNGRNEDLTVWEILEADQLKQAAVFLALSKIYFNFSDAPGDKWEQKSNKYAEHYIKAIELSRISIDQNDDGIIDEDEQLKEFKTLRLTR